MIFEWSVSSQNRSLNLQDWPASAAWTRAQVEDHLQSQPFLGVVIKERLVALILYRELQGLLEIHYLYTDPAFRRRGLMESLLNELIRRNPASKIWLEVHCKNQGARRLYQKMGFKNNGLRPGYYADGGDGLLLERAPEALAVS